MRPLLYYKYTPSVLLPSLHCPPDAPACSITGDPCSLLAGALWFPRSLLLLGIWSELEILTVRSSCKWKCLGGSRDDTRLNIQDTAWYGSSLHDQFYVLFLRDIRIDWSYFIHSLAPIATVPGQRCQIAGINGNKKPYTWFLETYPLLQIN